MLNIDTLKSSYTNEQILVILFTRLYFGTQEIEEVRSFLDEAIIDWKLFYKLILLNDIRGFVYHITTKWQLKIDQQVYDSLKRDTMAITLMGSYQANLIDRLMIEFERSGLTVIPYKGYTLAARYYEAPYLREGADIDLLISKNDLIALRECLYRNGFVPRYTTSEHQLGFILRFYRELAFTAPKDRMGVGSSVELKWRLLEYYWGQFCQYDFLVQHLQSYTASDGTSHIGLTPTYDFLCVASHHLIREPLLKFKYLIDLACIIQTSSSQLDWEEINLHFKLHNFSPFLGSGMNALAEVVGLELPVSDTSKVGYHLFKATEIRPGRKFYFTRIKLINLKQPFLKKIAFSLKACLFLLVPNINDLSMTTASVWTIPLITPVKYFRFLYLYLIKKR